MPKGFLFLRNNIKHICLNSEQKSDTKRFQFYPATFLCLSQAMDVNVICRGGNENLYIEEQQTKQWPKGKVSIKSDGQQFHQYQLSEHLPLTSHH
jgi:hypothetical protein